MGEVRGEDEDAAGQEGRIYLYTVGKAILRSIPNQPGHCAIAGRQGWYAGDLIYAVTLYS